MNIDTFLADQSLCSRIIAFYEGWVDGDGQPFLRANYLELKRLHQALIALEQPERLWDRLQFTDADPQAEYKHNLLFGVGEILSLVDSIMSNQTGEHYSNFMKA